MATKLDAACIARVSLHDPSHFSIQHSQTLHRLVLLQHWDIAPGSKVLELGCGQGDCTTVLAYAVGEQGRVVAVDPAELDYGASLISIRRPSLLPGLFYSSVGASGRRLAVEGSNFCRCPVYSRPSAEPYLSRPTGWADYMGPTIPSGLPLLSVLSLFHLFCLLTARSRI